MLRIDESMYILGHLRRGENRLNTKFPFSGFLKRESDRYEVDTLQGGT